MHARNAESSVHVSFRDRCGPEKREKEMFSIEGQMIDRRDPENRESSLSARTSACLLLYALLRNRNETDNTSCSSWRSGWFAVLPLSGGVQATKKDPEKGDNPIPAFTGSWGCYSIFDYRFI